MPDPAHQRFDLTGRFAVVTGAGAGLGRAIARGLAEHGASVVVADRDPRGLDETARAVRDTGRDAWTLTLDVRDPAAVTRAFQEIDGLVPHVDVLVNNAGIGPKARPEDLTLEQWHDVMGVNVTGYFLCAQETGRRMIAAERGGAILNLSSIAGSLAQGRGSFAYSVSKSAVNQLTRELAVEWARYGIRVNAIQPCQFRTPGVAEYLKSPNVEHVVQRWLDGIPMHRLGEPEDIVGPAVFLVSDAAAMVTGHLLPVDGGNLALNAAGTHTW